MPLRFGLPAWQNVTHRCKLLACLTNHEDNKEEPPEKEGLWDGAVQVYLQVEMTLGGPCMGPSAHLIPGSDGAAASCCHPSLREFQEAQSTQSFSPLLWYKW